ncbi:hypothetical protein [Bradyrhizobium sp. LMTR 3]|uniref:hypothetical protein n=1 Tax=Bradyrhizobium sp. LMTR 3 TaxID=189873 RepID=UPI000AEFB16E|nr:hypothetical protein [Bradyrhizobium sp. LMTR 3]
MARPLYWTDRLSLDANGQVEEAIDLAEARSACTCEVCGEVGVLRGGGWLTTRCYRYAEGRPPAEVRPGFENIGIVRYGIGDQRRTTCRRYDRENDAFVDVDPAYAGIEEEWDDQIPLSRLRPGRRFRLRPEAARVPALRLARGAVRAPDQLVYEIIESLSRAELLDREGEED